jgi:hypothetical protein
MFDPATRQGRMRALGCAILCLLLLLGFMGATALVLLL